MGQVTKAQKKAAAEAHAAAHGPTGDAWPFGPSGRTYGRARLTLKEVEQAAAAAIVPEPRYAKTLPHGIVRFVARDELLDVDVWHAEGSSIYVTIPEHGLMPLEPVDVLKRVLRKALEAENVVSYGVAGALAKLIITGQLPGVKYEA